jgi:chromosome transmission fidelity protein 4
VWDLTQQEPKQVKLIDGIIPAVKDKEYVGHSNPISLAFPDIWCSSRDFAYDCSAVWHPSGQYFVAASRTHGM